MDEFEQYVVGDRITWWADSHGRGLTSSMLVCRRELALELIAETGAAVGVAGRVRPPPMLRSG